MTSLATDTEGSRIVWCHIVQYSAVHYRHRQPRAARNKYSTYSTAVRCTPPPPPNPVCLMQPAVSCLNGTRRFGSWLQEEYETCWYVCNMQTLSLCGTCIVLLGYDVICARSTFFISHPNNPGAPRRQHLPSSDAVLIAGCFIQPHIAQIIPKPGGCLYSRGDRC